MNAPLKNKESYIYRKEDIISIKPGREDAWLDTIVERILQTISCPLIRVSLQIRKNLSSNLQQANML
jgi:hypothetical protein